MTSLGDQRRSHVISECIHEIESTIGFGMKSNLYNGFYYCNLHVLDYCLATKVA